MLIINIRLDFTITKQQHQRHRELEHAKVAGEQQGLFQSDTGVEHKYLSQASDSPERPIVRGGEGNEDGRTSEEFGRLR